MTCNRPWRQVPKTWCAAHSAGFICRRAKAWFRSGISSDIFVLPTGLPLTPPMETTAQPLQTETRLLESGITRIPETYWRSLQLFNGYRAAEAILLLLATSIWGATLQLGSRDLRLFLIGAAVYAVFALAMFALIHTRQRFTWQLALQVGGDIGFVVLLMYASGGLSSGLGLLLLTSLAAAGLVTRGQLTLFFAAIASIAVLLEHTYEVLSFSESGGQYAQAGLLSVAYFAIAWLAHTLAQRSLASERLAAQREIDLENMAQVNQLVIQDMEHGVIVVDGEGIVRQANSAAERMIGGLRSGDIIALKDRVPALYVRFDSWLRDQRGVRHRMYLNWGRICVHG
jgi:two-component system, NtrC family, sensor histidine kinase PilS